MAKMTEEERQKIIEGFYDYKPDLLQMIEELIVEQGLLKDSFQFIEQTENKNPGEYLIRIFEEEYPKNPNRITPNGIYSSALVWKEVLSGKYMGCISIKVSSSTYEKIDYPVAIVTKSYSKADDSVTVRIQRDDPQLMRFTHDLLIGRLKEYVSAQGNFGCCSEFIQCSDAKRCVHPNVLYASGCKYKWNLDHGRIFYGKNRNVDN